jgi:hypothetical protein
LNSGKSTKTFLILTVLLASFFLGTLAWPAEKGGKDSMDFRLKIRAFEYGSKIPSKYTCEGEDVSPPIAWEDPPEGTESFVFIVDDPDAPSGTFTHWILWDIPKDKRFLEEGTQEGTPGRNDFGKIGYGGPCPPRGHGPHRYFFKLYAIDAPSLNLKKGSSRSNLEKAMKDHIIREAEYMGIYER